MKKRMRAVLAGRERPAGEDQAEGLDVLMEPFAIGPLRVENRLVQAPLAGIGNWAFRRQMRRHGAGLTVSEMVASFGLHHGNRRTESMLRVLADEHPVAIQLFGPDPAVMAEAARRVEEAGADAVDINMGCPVPKITKTGAGASLLADPDRACAMIRAMVEAVDVPVTVKMRPGLTPATSRPVETARRFEEAGAAAIAFHPRAAAEEYAGTADHALTAQVVEAVSIPVIASGDIGSARDAVRVIEQTGCAAVMIGRAALGDPWIYRELRTGDASRPDLDAVIDEVVAFAAEVAEAIGRERAGHYMRKFYAWYLAGHDVPSAERDALMTDATLYAALDRLERMRIDQGERPRARLETTPALI